MNFDELKSRTVADLRKLAAQYGIITHHKQKAETIAKLIVEFVQNKPKEDTMKQKPEVPTKAAPHISTEEEVREAIKPLLEKSSFTVVFPGDNTVIFKGRGTEESVHLSADLIRVIKVKAASVSRGAMNPRGFLDKPTNSTANSGVVMMV